MENRLAKCGIREVREGPTQELVGTATVPWFGDDVDVEVIFEIEDGRTQPSDRQLAAFGQLMPVHSSFFADVPEGLFDHYHKARADSPLDERTVAELFPQIGEPVELRPMIELQGILVSHYDGDWSSYIGILASCDWELEHGLGIKVVNGVPVEFGTQDIVI